MAEAQSELIFESDALLLGRITYEEFVASFAGHMTAAMLTVQEDIADVRPVFGERTA